MSELDFKAMPPLASPNWKAISNTWKYKSKMCRWSLGNGITIKFRRDIWLPQEKPLSFYV